jgi:hypothetical protein
MNRSITLSSSCMFVLVAMATSGTARAQEEIGLGVAYDPRVPVGNLRDLVTTAGLAGLQGKWEYYVVDRRLAIGFDIQYQYFQHEGETTTVQIPNGAATASFTRYAYFLTFLPTVRWFPWPQLQAMRPFVELGVGVMNAVSAVLAADLSRHTNEAGFVAQPSVGFLWSIVSRESELARAYEEDPTLPRRTGETLFGLTASLAWAVTTADVIGANDVSFVGFQLGIYAKP